MLTLAFAQITYAVAFQWVEVTGGDNGVVGVWPSPWASSRAIYYYLALAVSGTAIALLWRGIYAPFGYTLRAARDSPVRADAIGIDVRRHRWLAFTVAGAAAGLAGARVLEQALADRPAFVELAEQGVFRSGGVGEEGLAERLVAADQLDRAHFDAGR